MATITTQTIKVDLTPGRVYPVLHVSQGDVGLEALEFHIYQNNQPYPIPSQVTTINIDGMTPVGVFSYPCTWTGNVVTAGLTATMTAERGIDICELALYDATNNKIGTCNFVIAVEESPYTNAHVSTSDMATIMAAATEVQQNTLLSKSWAVGDTGIRTGEDTNNSEYWANMSESWAVGGTGKRTGEDTNNSEYWSTVSHQYANTVSFKTYDTVAQMIADTGLLDGGVCRTLGYYAANDGGGALYKIVSAAPTTHYETLTNGLFAGLIIENGIVNIKKFGAYGDGVHDDTAQIQKALNYAATIVEDDYAISLYRYGGGSVYIPSGKYRITSKLVMPAHTSIYGEDQSSTFIINDSESGCIEIPEVTHIERLTFVGDASGNIIDSGETRTHDTVFSDLNFRCSNCSASIAISQGWNNIFRNIHIFGGAVGIYVSKHDTDNPNNYNFVNVQISNTNVRGIHMEAAVIARFESCDIEAVGQNSITSFDSDFMPTIKGVKKSFLYPAALCIESVGRGVCLDNCWFERNISGIDGVKAVALDLSGTDWSNNVEINNCNFWTDNTVFFKIGSSYSVSINGGFYNLNSQYNELGTLPTALIININNARSLQSFLDQEGVAYNDSRAWATAKRTNLTANDYTASAGITITTAQLTTIGKLNILNIAFNCTTAKSNGNTFASFDNIPVINDNQIRTMNFGINAGGGKVFGLVPYGNSPHSLGLLCSGPIPVENYYSATVIYVSK